jgi:hypothetical protein
MKDGQLFRVKVIKGTDDLPKYGKEFVAHDKISNATYPYCKFNKEFWLNNIDWYLEPIEVSDADIEAWAKKEYYGESFDAVCIDAYINGAKSMRDGEIKKEVK